jgi:hypothetical protein
MTMTDADRIRLHRLAFKAWLSDPEMVARLLGDWYIYFNLIWEACSEYGEALYYPDTTWFRN